MSLKQRSNRPVFILPIIKIVVNVVFEETLALTRVMFVISSKRVNVQTKMKYLVAYRYK